MYDVIHKTGSIERIAAPSKRTESRPYATCTNKVVKFGRVVFELCERTDKQTYSSQ